MKTQKMINITRIDVVNGKKFDYFTVNRIIRHSQLERFRQLVTGIISRKMAKEVSVLLTYKEMENKPLDKAN